jgi:hypothetical protein
MITLPTKDPNEGVFVSFCFGREVLPGEIIDTVSVDVSVHSGVDDNPSALAFGTPDRTGSPTIRQEFRGGNPATTYHLRAKATLSSGRTLIRAALLPVETI